MENTIVTRGTVVASETFNVTGQASTSGGNPVVTAVRVRPGSSLHPGQVLVEVSGRPIFVLPGSVPSYRDLRPGASGKDVAQLQRALAGLGYASGDRSGNYGDRTKRAVASFYSSIGYQPMPSSADDDAQLSSAQDQVIAAKRALAADRQALAFARTTAGSGAAAQQSLTQAELGVTYAKQDLARAVAGEQRVEETTGPMVPQGELVFLPSFPARVGTVGLVVGAVPGQNQISVSSGALQVVSAVQPDQAAVLQPGQRVRLFSEALNVGATGVVSAVLNAAPLAAASAFAAAGGSSLKYVITTPTTPLPVAFGGQDIRVTVVAASSAASALVVPVAAVSSAADGLTTVTVARPDGSQHRVEVTVGINGAGYVAVAPAGGSTLVPGDRVIVGMASVATKVDPGASS